MDRLKTFLLYILILLALYILTEFLITVGFRARYVALIGTNRVSQVTVDRAEATRISGRMTLTVENVSGETLDNYIKVDLFSPRNVFLGTHYIDVSGVREGQKEEFQFSFKQRDVSAYLITQTNTKPDPETLSIDLGFVEIIPEDLTTNQIIFGTLLAMLIFF